MGKVEDMGEIADMGRSMDASMDSQPDMGKPDMGKSIAGMGTSMALGMDMGMGMGMGMDMRAQERSAWTYGLDPCLASRGAHELDWTDSSPRHGKTNRPLQTQGACVRRSWAAAQFPCMRAEAPPNHTTGWPGGDLAGDGVPANKVLTIMLRCPGVRPTKPAAEVQIDKPRLLLRGSQHTN